MGGCLLGTDMLCAGRRPCSPTTRGRPTRRSSASAGASMWLERLREHAALRRGLARAPAPRRVLEAGLGLRGLRRDQLPGLRGRRLGRRLPERDPALARRAPTAPRKGLIGPWAHNYPHCGVPGPAIGFLQEALRWWDHWLKGADTGDHGRADAARLDAGAGAPPAAIHAERPGRWVAEPAWPSPTIEVARAARSVHARLGLRRQSRTPR